MAALSVAIANANAAAGIAPIQQCTVTGTEVPSEHYSPAFRPQPETDGIERWVSFVDPVFVFGPPSGVIGEVWLAANRCFGFYFFPPRRLLGDPARHDSYIDPEWSPDGRFLAYTKTDVSGASSSIYIQEFERDLLAVDIAVASTPVGVPMLVADGTGGIHHRHPTWNPDGTALAFDSDLNGTSIDVYTVDVDPIAQTHGSSIQRTSDESHAEFSPSWSPDGTRIACQTNALGVFQIAIVNLVTAQQAILFPNFPHRMDPAWSRDGNFVYYLTTNPANNQVLAKIQVDTGEIQELSLSPPDPAAPTVSKKVVLDPSGGLEEYVAFSGQGPGGFVGPFGTQIWRAKFQIAPPPRAAAFTMPPYQVIRLHSDKPVWCLDLEAVDQTFDLTDVIPTSAQLLSAGTGSVDRIQAIATKSFVIADRNQNGILDMPLCFAKEDLRQLLSGVTENGNVPLTCQGNLADGRRFSASLTVEVKKGGNGESEASIYPNPFNPAATLTFHTRIPGPVTVSVFDLAGRRVCTLLDRAILPVGYHDIAIDGNRVRLASGVYFYRIVAPGMVARGRFAVAK